MEMAELSQTVAQAGRQVVLSRRDRTTYFHPPSPATCRASSTTKRPATLGRRSKLAKIDHFTLRGLYKHPQNRISTLGKPPVNSHRSISILGQPPVNSHRGYAAVLPPCDLLQEHFHHLPRIWIVSPEGQDLRKRRERGARPSCSPVPARCWRKVGCSQSGAACVSGRVCG